MRNASVRPATRAEFHRALTDLIGHGLSSRRRVNAPVDVAGDTPLFESGLVDSLAILELIAFVERATGRTIPPRHVRLERFGTIDRICGAFWVEEDEVAHGIR